MATLFHLSEILKFAIHKEQESKELYEHLACETKNDELKILFTTLAQEEIQHEKFYAGMMKLADQRLFAPESEEFSGYMQELITTSRTVNKISDFNDLAMVLNYAIAREKDSILFYSGLLNYVPRADREGIYAIIREEVKHAAQLTRIKNELLKNL